MRPPQEVRQALAEAAARLSTPERSPTLYELATHAQVGFSAARYTVDNMRRAGVLAVVRTRKVPYRNRPVAEYCPRQRPAAAETARPPLHEVFASWALPTA